MEWLQRAGAAVFNPCSSTHQSWSGLVKLLDPTRCDSLFVHVGDGRRWYVPAGAIGGGSGILLGGPKCAEFEIEPSARLPTRRARVAQQR
jgi:hypothetical protein